MTTPDAPIDRAEENGPAALLDRKDVAVFTLVLVFYLVTRLIGLAEFPIYFFCDWY